MYELKINFRGLAPQNNKKRYAGYLMNGLLIKFIPRASSLFFFVIYWRTTSELNSEPFVVIRLLSSQAFYSTLKAFTKIVISF